MDCKLRERVKLAVSLQIESNWVSIQRKRQINSQFGAEAKFLKI